MGFILYGDRSVMPKDIKYVIEAYKTGTNASWPVPFIALNLLINNGHSFAKLKYIKSKLYVALQYEENVETWYGMLQAWSIVAQLRRSVVVDMPGNL